MFRWLSSGRASYAKGTPGRILVFIDRSGSMQGEPTEVVNMAMPHVRRMLPGLHVIDFDHSSDIAPAVERAIPLMPERSVIISDGYIDNRGSVKQMSGKIDAIFCGKEIELQFLPRRIRQPEYREWGDHHDYKPFEHYAAGAYNLWEMTRGRGAFNHFRWDQGPDALFDLIVHRQRRTHHHQLPDLHIHHGAPR